MIHGRLAAQRTVRDVTVSLYETPTVERHPYALVMEDRFKITTSVVLRRAPQDSDIKNLVGIHIRRSQGLTARN